MSPASIFFLCIAYCRNRYLFHMFYVLVLIDVSLCFRPPHIAAPSARPATEGPAFAQCTVFTNTGSRCIGEVLGCLKVHVRYCVRTYLPTIQYYVLYGGAMLSSFSLSLFPSLSLSLYIYIYLYYIYIYIYMYTTVMCKHYAYIYIYMYIYICVPHILCTQLCM